MVCDPDILSFNIQDHRMQFAILASDGLWDTHTNEDAVTVIGSRYDGDEADIDNKFNLLDYFP